MSEKNEIKISAAKGRPMLTWVGKRPLRSVTAFPAQHVETFSAADAGADTWKNWPGTYPQGGLLFHGDNKEVLGHLLANGFRGRVKLIYIDPPFDSGADYVRKVQLRGGTATAKIDGESYALGEQIQYTDIWANDNYLQFMYERLMLLKELLDDGGSIFLHCDEKQSHRLRCLLDEVFGPEGFVNEIVWHYSNKYGANSQTFDVFHNSIYWYSKGKLKNFEPIRVPVKKVRTQPVRKWNKELNKNEWLKDENGNYLYQESKEKDVGDVWEIPVINPMALERNDYPTQKPEQLLDWILRCATQPSDLILDCFIGSGTTAAVAQKLGRHWIGCDINKGAIQTTAKRLQTIMTEQAEAADKKQTGLFDVGAAPRVCPTEGAHRGAPLQFGVWRVNDYDLKIQRNEAIKLACEHVGVERLASDSFFDGKLGKKLVKIVPFEHPLSPLDLEEFRRELEARPEVENTVVFICLGIELAARTLIDDWNRLRKGAETVNKIEVIELRTDAKYGNFIKHEPAVAKVAITRDGDKIAVKIEDFISPTILKRLDMDMPLFKAKISDWRSQIDCVMIDTAYDGSIFNVILSDVPEKKSDLIDGSYNLTAPDEKATIAVKIIDMLGEEVLVVKEI